jgi:hypothetical protein
MHYNDLNEECFEQLFSKGAPLVKLEVSTLQAVLWNQNRRNRNLLKSLNRNRLKLITVPEPELDNYVFDFLQ